MDMQSFEAQVREVALVTPTAATRIAKELVAAYQMERPIKVEDMGEVEVTRMLQMLRRRQRAGGLAPKEVQAVVKAVEAVAAAEEKVAEARARRDAALAVALGEGAPPKVLCDASGLSSSTVRALRPADALPRTK